MLTVHHLESSRSQRVLWLLEELGVDYEIKRYERNKKTMLAPPELLAVHPLGKSPVITDDGNTIAESGAIVEYLIGKYGGGRFVPAAGTPEKLRYTYWLHYAEGSAMPPLLLKLVFEKMKSGPVPFFIKPVVRGIADKVLSMFVHPQLKLHAEYMEKALSEHPWFAGDELTGADFLMSFPLEAVAARAAKAVGVKTPHIDRFLATIKARPAYQRALERGGPYELLR
jgi:glutathione S-transferase